MAISLMRVPSKRAVKNVPRSFADDTIAPAVQEMVAVDMYG